MRTNKLAAALAVTLALAAISAVSPAQAAPSPSPANLKAWQAKIAEVPQPSAKGCFTSNYPATTWQEIACAPGPSYPAVPKRQPRPPALVGNGNDVSAQAPGGGFISKAIGSFDTVSGVTSESSPIANSGPAVSDAYTLQINTDFFASTACAGSPNPDCKGWEQFIFGNRGTAGNTARIHIQYWLIQYNAPCPAGGWNQIVLGGGTDIYCYKDNSSGYLYLPNQPIGNLENLSLTGEVTSTSDRVTLTVGGTAYSQIGDNAVNASTGWNASEFNIFGYYGNAAGGSNASFNNGSALTVRNRIEYGGTQAPICLNQGFTGETNNLAFPSTPPGASQPGPAMIFNQDTIGGASSNCDSAVTVGDTHQHTVAGLLYDFQASGDFVEAQAGTDFEVQTRKASGAPNWPNASVNKAVATRMGTTKVVLCGDQRLIVDGKATSIPGGTSLSLPTGVDIAHLGSTYIVTDKAGNTLRATSNPTYIDVAVGVGSWPSTVRGLLGNPNNDVHKLEAKNGTQYTVPLSFNDLYRNFGDSWRVAPLTTMLSSCGTVSSGNPAQPFHVSDLNPDVAQRSRTVCLIAEVAPAWLDSCTLDVAVLGDNAATVYLGQRPPLVDGNGAGCGTTNIALNKPATASSAEGTGMQASNAVDGNPDTRWSSNPSDPQWLQVDLGSTRSICRVTLNWEAAYARAFQIQTSTNGTAWTSIYSTTSATGGNQTLNVSGTGRYIRLYATARATQFGDSLWEFQVNASE